MDVFETIFTVDSVHKGTVTSLNDKGATIGLPYGVEGFAPARHLAKADGTTARAEEVLDFKVIEFSKESKRIVVSHARLHEEVKRKPVALTGPLKKPILKTAKKPLKK